MCQSIACDVLTAMLNGACRADVDRLDRQLRTFSSTLDAWLLVQKGWVALEAVFGAADIQRQLPAEARAFAQVDKTFKDIMRRTHDRPNALQVRLPMQSSGQRPIKDESNRPTCSA